MLVGAGIIRVINKKPNDVFVLYEYCEYYKKTNNFRETH